MYDKIIIGAGLYGLYSALFCCRRGQRVVVLECDSEPFKRATYINQARIHNGYHYPRSISTALKSAGYFERFSKDYAFCINREFDQIYATSSSFSWTDGTQFKDFCSAAGIPCEEVHAGKFFKTGVCDGAFRTREYTYDAALLRDFFLSELGKYSELVKLEYSIRICRIEKTDESYTIFTEDGRSYESEYVINATYAGTNQILELAGFGRFKIKYELCEIILCEANDKLTDYGFTVMDGPFFSIMPFGKTGYHSLTSVTFTPHITSYDELPAFPCQEKSNGYCTSLRLGNCNDCPAKPNTAFPYMSSLAKKYLLDDYDFKYIRSLFSMKPILMSSEIDDSRPTIIKKYSTNPTFVGVLSGKINTVYDLDEVLSDG
ncbi:MAG: FAD-dependent oxidoreductase [Clostridiales bacterium]|nr:FAD-dependent oxidoreductase [Clostridiales bacterium]